MPTFYVNPATGSNTNPGNPSTPFKSLTHALGESTPGSTVHLSPGTYSTGTGERFPITIPREVTVIGSETGKGNGIEISGGGNVNTSDGRQNIAVLLENDAQLRGVAVTNTAVRGTGVWIQSGNPTVSNCTFKNCKREGIRVTGTAKAIVSDNVCIQNDSYGIWIVGQAKGEVRGNLCQDTGTGLAVGDDAAPLIEGNTIAQNRTGVILANDAYPVLRNNTIEKNTQDGLVLIGNAKVDLGSSPDPGGNILRENGQFDLQNATKHTVVSAGNQVNPTKVKGLVDLVANASPTPSPIPSPTPSPTPSPSPTPTPTPGPTPIPSPTPTGLVDIDGHWAEAFIRGLVDKGYISGFKDRTFRPEASITRAQYAAIIAQAFTIDFKRGANNFADVATDFWGYNAIIKANRMGFISGFPDNTFRPGQNLTRIQALLSLVGGLGLGGGRPDTLNIYSDRAQIPTYATNAVATATYSRLVVNFPQIDRLNPLRDVTRAEVAALIYQALVYRGEATPINSPYIVIPNDDPTLEFWDIESHWAKDFIVGLADKDFISGFKDGTFRPDITMTRAQYAALLTQAFNPRAKRPAVRFSDVPETFWAYRAIQTASQGGFLSGVSAEKFEPNANVQRFQVMISLVSGLGLSGGSESLLGRYTDAESLPSWARSQMATATQKRIVLNYPSPSQLDPFKDATRAEVAAMVYQALTDAGKVTRINSPYIVSL